MRSGPDIQCNTVIFISGLLKSCGSHLAFDVNYFKTILHKAIG